MVQSFQNSPYSLTCTEGKQLRSFGTQIVVKATTKQTGGAFNLFEVTCPPGFATSLDIHYVEDVAVYVLEGALTFFWGHSKRDALVGSYFYQPRGIPHGFRVEGEAPARILYMTVPGGIDQFFFEQPQLVPNGEAITAAARYKIEILGPLPE